MIRSILMVCTGNICRSPYAAARFQQQLPNLSVSSAGTHALVEQAADATADVTASARGVNLSPHVAQQLSTKILASHDICLVMERQQLKKIHRRHPEAIGKVFMLSRWIGNRDIADPYQRSADYFDAVFNVIDDAIESWESRIK